jgi:hypothetical protein
MYLVNQRAINPRRTMQEEPPTVELTLGSKLKELHWAPGTVHISPLPGLTNPPFPYPLAIFAF